MLRYPETPTREAARHVAGPLPPASGVEFTTAGSSAAPAAGLLGTTGSGDASPLGVGVFGTVVPPEVAAVDEFGLADAGLAGPGPFGLTRAVGVGVGAAVFAAGGGGCQGCCVGSTYGRTVSGLTGVPAKLTPTIAV